MRDLVIRAATILGSRVLTRASQVVAFVLLARVLSPTGFGAYGVLTSAVFLAGQIGNLGLRQSAAYRIGQKRMTDGEAMGVMLAFWPVATAVCAGVVLFINRQALMDLGAGGSLSLGAALVLAMAGVMFTVLIQGVFLGRGEIRNFTIADAGPRVLQSALAAILWLVGALTIATALWSFAVGFILLIPIVAWFALRGASPLRLALKDAPDMISHGLLFAVSMFLITLQGRVGVFFLSGADGHEAAGQFFAAQRATEIVLELATAVGLVLFSEATRAGSLKDNMAAALKTALGLSGLFLILGVGVALAAPWVVKLVLGEAYAEAAPIVRILAMGLAPAAFVKIMNSVMSGTGRPMVSAAVVGGGVAVNLVLALILFNHKAAEGVAYSIVSTQFGMALTYFFLAENLYRFDENIKGKFI